MDASAEFCLIIYRVSMVQTSNQFLFMMTAAEYPSGMLIPISAPTPRGLGLGVVQCSKKLLCDLYICFLTSHRPRREVTKSPKRT